MTCIQNGLFRNLNCTRYSKEFLLQKERELKYKQRKRNINDNKPSAVERYRQSMLMRKARQEAKKAFKSGRVLDYNDYMNKTIDNAKYRQKKRVVWKEDGYDHTHCPAADLYDIELNNILDDTFYCIETNSLPGEGGAFDQTAIFRVAFMTLKTEREILKSEKEQKAMEEASKKSNNNSTATRPKMGGGR